MNEVRKYSWGAIPDMFHYLKDENIKKSSNDLEGLNGILDTHILKHKGLRIDRLISFVSLWFNEKKFKIKK